MNKLAMMVAVTAPALHHDSCTGARSPVSPWNSWLATSTMIGATRVSNVMAGALLDHYRRTLDEARTVGFAAYANQQLAPYVRAATAQFSPDRRTLTEDLLERSRSADRSR